MKQFNRSAKSGFTLVELIIVIAILAILAGIAIPVYSNYIQKANRAADEQLLGAVNTAFAAACLENGFNAKDVVDASLTVTTTGEKKTITGVSSVTLKDGVTPLTAKNEGYGLVLLGAHPSQLAFSQASFDKSFEKYFGDNKNTELKFYSSSSDFELKDGCFVGKSTDAASASAASSNWTNLGLNNGYYEFTNGEQTIRFSEEEYSAMIASTFFKSMEISTLTGDIDSVIGAASQVITESNIGVLPGFDTYLSSKGISTDDSEAVAKGLVLYISSLTAGKDASTVLASIKSGTFATAFADSIHDPNNKTEAVVDAALAYALVEAFANTEEGKVATITVDGQKTTVSQYLNTVNQSLGADKTGTENLNAVLTMLQNVSTNADFKWYLKDDTDSGAKASTDLAGYINAMSAINSNVDAIDLETYLAQGLSGDYMTNLLSLINNP